MSIYIFLKGEILHMRDSNKGCACVTVRNIQKNLDKTIDELNIIIFDTNKFFFYLFFLFNKVIIYIFMQYIQLNLFKKDIEEHSKTLLHVMICAIK